ncbi:hypothetical protein SRHO_G00002240 [Serrasalmus rhombeus]
MTGVDLVSDDRRERFKEFEGDFVWPAAKQSKAGKPESCSGPLKASLACASVERANKPPPHPSFPQETARMRAEGNEGVGK